MINSSLENQTFEEAYLMKIEFSLGVKEPYTEMDITEGTTIEELYKKNIDSVEYDKYGALVDNEVKPLTYKIKGKCRIILLDIRSKQAYLMYQHSLVLLLLKAVKDVIGDERVDVHMTINEGLFIQVDDRELDEDEIAEIYRRMKALVKDDLPIEERTFTRKEGQKLMAQEGLEETSRVLRRFSEDETIRIYTLGDYSDFYYNYMVPSTGYLKSFELMKYRSGVLLRYAQPEDPNDIPDFVDEYMMYKAFNEQMRWNELIGVKYITDLNDKIENGDYKEMIMLSEALHDKKIVEIADDITAKGKRIILILGPSSSGKTTFAHRLIIQLRVNELKPLYVGTDDYFKERAEAPVDENGEFNFEGLDALDVDLFQRQINDLLSGKEVDMPVFDFINGHKEYGKRITKLGENQPVIIEGIQSFNPDLTGRLDDDEKFKIYISPLTQINLNAHNRIPTTDTRIVRRMLRDYRTRGYGAEATLRTWGKVHDGENANIFPYSSEADVFFNSVHVYEMAVLKKYVEPLLAAIGKDAPEYPEAQRLLRLFGFVDSIDDNSVLSGNSILREFIGGSVFQ